MTATERVSLYLQWGRPGDPIAGSALVRGYCAVCGDPIRVRLGTNPELCECQDCRGALPRKVLNQLRSCRTGFRPAIGGRE